MGSAGLCALNNPFTHQSFLQLNLIDNIEFLDSLHTDMPEPAGNVSMQPQFN